MNLQNPPMAVSESDIAAFEARHRIRLPADYRDFLLQSNGGYLDGTYNVDISPQAGSTTLQQFYRMRDGPRSTQTLEYMRSLLGSRLPPTLLSIGSDLGGAKICLGIDGSEYGKVFFWDPGADYDDTKNGSFENIQEVAPTFSEFLRRITPADARNRRGSASRSYPRDIEMDQAMES